MEFRIKKVTAPKANREAEISYPAPDNVGDAVETYGEALTLALINRSLDIAAQAKARTMLEVEANTVKMVQDALADFTPELRTPADKKGKVAKAFSGLSAEEQKALIAEWQSKK